MVVANITNLPLDTLGQLGEIALWLQAVGFIVILWILFQVVELMINRRRMKLILNFKKDIDRIEKKIDVLNKRLQK